MSTFDPYTHLNISKNPDGSITRFFQPPTVEANPEPSPGTTVVSKDVTIDPQKKTWVRIIRPTKLPSNDNTVARLPIVMYFHNGGFVFLSPDYTDNHQKCSQIADDIPSIVVSASYRHAPEHRFPTQYQDAYDAVLWVKDQLNDPNGEKWLKDYGDPSRCYLYGSDCGGNIAFNVSMQVFYENPLSIIEFGKCFSFTFIEKIYF